VSFRIGEPIHSWWVPARSAGHRYRTLPTWDCGFRKGSRWHPRATGRSVGCRAPSPPHRRRRPVAGSVRSRPGEGKIIVFQRGPVSDPNHAQHDSCFFSDRIRAGEQAGYDVVIVANHHLGSNAGEFPDAFLCGSQGSPVLGTAAGLYVGHRFMHEAFGKSADYTVPTRARHPTSRRPACLGRGSAPSRGSTDGLRPAGRHTVDDRGRPVRHPQTGDRAFAVGFGDISVHEVEVPPGSA
jgi:hypothetical protein